MAIWQPPTAPVFPRPDALDWALKHVESFGDTIFLPHAFEYKAVRHNWTSVRDWLSQQDMRNWAPRPSRRLLASKTRYSYRYVTQLDPLEHLAFTALIYEIGPQLESIRVPQTEGVVYSWRFATAADGQMYDSHSRWHHFNTRCLDLAEARSCRWVVIADIADFFPHVYLHPLEQVLDRATGHNPVAYCILRLIRNWNALVSYGLPVGLAGSRILAEAAISDIDSSLRGSGRKYCRYSDDIRIFCRSEGDAKRALEDLAMLLFNVHGLTLQPMKTLIVSKTDYANRFATSGERIELESLTEKLHDLLEEAGFENDYEEEIDYDDLPDEIREQIDSLNLVQVLDEQIRASNLDPIVVRFLLYRLRQLSIEGGVRPILKNFNQLQPVIDSVMEYLASLRDVSETMRKRIGKAAIAAARKASSGVYQRLCLLSLFSSGREFDNEERFEKLYNEFGDAPTRRELILALGRARATHWFMARRQDYQSLEPWSRRAFLAAFSCVPADARVPFYRSLRGGADILETAILKWVADNPFSSSAPP